MKDELAMPRRAGPDPVAARLRERVEAALPRLRAIADGRAARRPRVAAWSPKQILGHLIDSAANNHQRFVRAQLSDDLVFAGYEQDGWVETQGYADAPWRDLVELWGAYNRHLARVIERIPAEVRNRLRDRHNLDRVAFGSFEAGAPATLDAFMADYVDHLEHHLRQVFARSELPEDVGEDA